jgi:hypothetical protein
VGYDRYGVIKARGADPEVFWIAWFDSKLPKGELPEDVGGSDGRAIAG